MFCKVNVAPALTATVPVPVRLKEGGIVRSIAAEPFPTLSVTPVIIHAALMVADEPLYRLKISPEVVNPPGAVPVPSVAVPQFDRVCKAPVPEALL